MTVALYCPMKPPDDPVPSGDREISRQILRILDRLGEPAEVASRLVTWQATPAASRFAELEAASATEVERLLATWREGSAPSAWITYHLYHKAPDWIGPAVTAALQIPYIVIEASRAKKHAASPWAPGFAAADRALAAADAVVAMHGVDREGLSETVGPERLFPLAPFIDIQPFAAIERTERVPGMPVRLLAAGMMRPGNKEACYRVLADALSRIDDLDWHLTIAGDGEALDRVRPLFDPDRTTFLGAVDRQRMPAVYANADLFVWPAVNEPFGLVFLEAQAAQLAVVGGTCRGVPEIVADGETGILVPPDDAGAFAEAVAALIRDPARRDRYAAAGRMRATGRHDIAQATDTLAAILAAARRHRESVHSA